jgi:hypothetical protein
MLVEGAFLFPLLMVPLLSEPIVVCFLYCSLVVVVGTFWFVTYIFCRLLMFMLLGAVI